jgi:4a-hydroxytetrahydrobiopterin dehydratase
MSQKLDDAALQKELEATPGWTVENGQLTRAITFDSYSGGAGFAVRVMMLSEKLDHHPDAIEIGWKRVTLRYVTHSAGGLTALDFDAARKVNALG